MALNSRQQEILNILYGTGRASVVELSKKLYVSEMTIRRDLAEMQRGGYLRRYRGGAILRAETREMPITERLLVDKNEKMWLCQQCERYLSDNMTIYLDSSSTCQYMIPFIGKLKNVLLVTNSVNTLISASALHIPCLLIGGEYYEQDMCLVGSIAEEYARGLNVDVAFFTTAAYSEDGIISDFDVRQTAIRKILMQNSKKNVFLFESSKLNKKLPYTLCRSDLDDIDVIIASTDG